MTLPCPTSSPKVWLRYFLYRVCDIRCHYRRLQLFLRCYNHPVRKLSALLFSFFLLLAMGGASAQDLLPEPEPANQEESGQLILQADPAEPGDAVKVRLRDEALVRILGSPYSWSLRNGDNEIPARLVTPSREPDDQVELKVIDGGRLDSRDRQVIIDRGADPPEIDYIEIDFSSIDVLTTVVPSAGPTREDFSQTGKEQAVLQRVTEEGLLSVTRVEFSPLPVNRYIRLIIRNGADHAVSAVTGGSESGADLHQVPVALGPMRSLPTGGGSIWPLVLESNLLPLYKIKIVSESPGMLRRVRFVRLDENLREAEREAEMIYADSLPAGKLALTNNYMELPATSKETQPALIVEDGMQAVLPIKSVEAYAAELYICFIWPEDGNPVLTSGPSSLPEADIDENTARFIGSFSGISETEPNSNVASVEDADSSPARRDSLLSELDLGRLVPEINPGFRTLLPAGLGLVLLGLVILLIARGREST